MVWCDMMAIHKDAPHPENALRFIDFILRPEIVIRPDFARAAELGIAHVLQGVEHKAEGFARLLSATGLQAAQTAYMGDDLLDLPVFVRVGLAGAPADSTAEVLHHAHWVSRFPGGRGAVREFVELLLTAQGRWNAIVDSFLV